MSDLAKGLRADSLTPEQVNAITYAYMDICATEKFLNGDPLDGRACNEIAEAVPLTKADLEKAFPFLIEDVEDE
jgi:hypothetical protein